MRARKNQTGFTIIEVMIVLAIAGLIMVVVFLAVPTLQRNARDTSRKQDARALLAARLEYGPQIGGITSATQEYGCTLDTGTTANCEWIKGAILGYYSPNNVTFNTINRAHYTQPDPSWVGGTDNIIISAGAKCGASPTDIIEPTESNKSYTAYFRIESGNVTQCIQL